MKNSWRRRLLALVIVTVSSAQSQLTAASRDLRTGIYRGRVVTYEVVNGVAIYEGDIILDSVQELASGISQQGFGIAYTNFLWPLVGSVYQVPYVITGV